MKSKRRMAGMLMVLGILFALPVFAGSVNVTFTGTGGAVQGNVYVAPYYLSVAKPGDAADQVPAGQISVVCDDYTHDVVPGDKWTATVSNFSNLSQTRFAASSNSERLYEEAAYLVNQMSFNPTQAGDINFAIWGLFDPAITSGSTPGYGSGAAAWANNASMNAPTFALNASYFSDVRILTPTSPTTPQEYIYVASEPAALLLLLCGGILGLFHRRASLVKSNLMP